MAADQWSISFTVTESESGVRLDTLISVRYPEFSRSTISRLIREGAVRVNNQSCKPAHKPLKDDQVSGSLPAFRDSDTDPLIPEFIPLDILFEDGQCLVLNKPPGIVVHPSPGHNRQTLANALIHYLPALNGIGDAPERPGIVHRLDKDTSGLLLVAKSEAAFKHLSAQFKARSIEKKYLGLVYGRPDKEMGRIELPIGRHAAHRKKMSATRYSRGRPAETLWQVKCRYDRITLIEYTIKTGRTHQIRVHSAAINCPIIGDAVYGIKKPQKLMQIDPNGLSILQSVNRQMLHAWQIRFAHPETGETIFIEAPPAPDMASILRQLNAVYIDSDSTGI